MLEEKDKDKYTYMLRTSNDEYKYWKYNDSDGLIATIQEMSIRCNKAENMNDEYDCAPPFVCNDFMDNNAIYVNKYENSLRGMIYNLLKNDYVTSFTLSGYDNVLMWGHYTNKYSGGVIEFNNTNQVFKVGSVVVGYEDNPIEVTKDFCEFWIDNREDIPNPELVFYDLLRMYNTKSKHWGYENEIRYWTGIPEDCENGKFDVPLSGYKEELKIVKISEDEKYVHVPIYPKNINAIYIGHKMSGLDKLRLYCAMKKNNINVPVRVLKPKRDEYKLEFVEGDFSLRYIMQHILNDFEHKNDCELKIIYDTIDLMDENDDLDKLLDDIYALQNKRTDKLYEIRKLIVDKTHTMEK